MAALTFAPFVLLFTFSGIFAQSPEKMTVKSGEDVTLPCQAPPHTASKDLVWRRSDQKPDERGFYRDDRPVETNQLKCNGDRLECRDPEMKNGDASLTLRKVMASNTGTYQCSVGGVTIKTFNLVVADSDDTAGQAGDGANGGHGGLIATFIVAVVCCAGLVVWLKRRSQKKKSE